MNKMKLSAIFFVVLMITSIAMIAMPIQPVKGQLAATQPVSGPLPPGTTVQVTMPTDAFLSFEPNPIGLGQQLLVNMWITPGLASNQRFIPQGLVVTITRPDGTKDVRTLDSEPATGAQWFILVPDQVGTWTLKMDFLGTYFPAGLYYDGRIVTNSNSSTLSYGSCYYQPSSTSVQNLTVQQDFVYSWPPAPLPTDYWTRPGNLNNREWWPILGNYPGTGYQGGGPTWDALYPNTNTADSPGQYNFVPWVQAPNSAHILWQRQTTIAGLIGGPAGQYGITAGGGTPSVIYSGRCYQTMTVPINGVPTSCAVCYDLRTGQQFYSIPGGVTPQYIAYINPVATSTTIAGEELGSASWSVELLTISGSYLIKINPNTGAIAGNYSISPLSGGIFYNQISGYVMSVQTIGTGANREFRLINWTTRGSGNLASRIQSNISWPLINQPNQYTGGQGVNQTNTYTIGGSITGTGMLPTDFTTGIAAYITRVTQPGTEILWGINVTAINLATGQWLPWKVMLTDDGTYSGSAVVADHGKVAFLTQHGDWLAYDLYTGALAWRSEQMEYPWASASFGAYAVQSAYGMLFRQSYAGVYAFNWTNGKIVWNYKAPAYANFESPYIENGQEEYSFNAGAIIADGKMYTYNTEHSPTYPTTRGWGIHCINITTGEGIWTLDNPMTYGGIADGYLTASNPWDGSTYVFGKGLSATTVTAPNVVMPKGNGIVIEGTVLDQSPGQPNTPCVSKDSMQTQMQYLHLQAPIAGLWGNETISGVPVVLQAIDSNNNVIEIGTTTTNGYYGTFGYTWTPPNEGQYTILAAFAGDDSYGSSGAATTISVGPAPTVAPTATPPAAAVDYMPTLIGILVAVIVAIVVSVIALAVVLRKHA